MKVSSLDQAQEPGYIGFLDRQTRRLEMDATVRSIVFALLLTLAPSSLAHKPKPEDFTILADSALLKKAVSKDRRLEVDFILDPESAATEENILRIYFYRHAGKNKRVRSLAYIEANHESCAAISTVMISVQDGKGIYKYHDFNKSIPIADSFSFSIQQIEKLGKGEHMYRIELNGQVAEMVFPYLIRATEVVNVHGKATLNKLELVK
jgi:hypothetical protein